MSDPVSVLAEKAALRTRMKELLSSVSADEKRQAGVAVAAHLDVLLDEEDTVVLFGSTALEIDTRPLDALAKKRRCRRLAPKIDGDRIVFVDVGARAIHDFAVDAYGIPAVDGPVVGLAGAAVVVVPGLAFDEAGGRVGYGKGFYDRALADVKGDTLVVGVGLDVQWVERVPRGPADRAIAYGCSPSRGLREHA